MFVPVGVTDKNRAAVMEATNEYEALFKKSGVRIKIDDRDNYTAGWKFNHWELKVRLGGSKILLYFAVFGRNSQRYNENLT